MKTIKITKPNIVETIEQSIPERGEGEVLLRVNYVGICGSDIMTYTGKNVFVEYPRIPGHEISATIAETDNPFFKKGSIVSVLPYTNCGHCLACKKNKPNACENNKTMGNQRDGAFSEYIVVPKEKIINTNGLGKASATLIEPASIGVHASKRLFLSSFDKCLVIGDGAIGLFTFLSIKSIYKGIEVFVSGRHEARLSVFEKYGARIINRSEIKDFQNFINFVTYDSGFDAVFEATGTPLGFNDALSSVGYTGKIVVVGNGKQEVSFNPTVFVKKEITLAGSRNATIEDFRSASNLLTTIKTDDIITSVIHSSSAVDAFEQAKDKKSMKVLVEF